MLVFDPFTIRTQKKGKLFTTKFSQAILRNHLGFITTSAINLCFMQRQGWYLTFINICETVFNSDNLFLYVLKAIAS